MRVRREYTPTFLEIRRRLIPDYKLFRSLLTGGESHSGMKICREKSREGSSPSSDTNLVATILVGALNR